MSEHQVLRGLVANLPVGGASDTCIDAGTLASSVEDADVPAADDAFWYLVRATNVCGTGSYGLASGGSPRLAGACP